MSLLSLPNEVLNHIFSTCDIRVVDLRSLMLTCQRFLFVIQNSNEIWKRKFILRWPRLSHIQEQQQQHQWQMLVRQRMTVADKVHKALTALSAVSYPEGEAPLALMDELISNDEFGFVEDELLQLIFHQNKNEMLTERYYGCKVLHYLRTRRLERVWREFFSRPMAQQSLIEGAVLISQWGQMDQELVPSLHQVRSIIDGIVERVAQVVSASNAKSPKKILFCINKVLYEEMGFQGNVNVYHAFSNSYIDKVLETRKGIPITLCIIYQEIANRSGVPCEPVSFHQHFLLRWREFPERDEFSSYTYIDAFNGGGQHLPRSCPALIGQSPHHIPRQAYAGVEPLKVFQRMVNNLIQCSRIQWDHGRGDQSGLRDLLHFSRLACVVTPGQTPFIVEYAELCVFLGIQLEEAIELLQSEEAIDDFYGMDAEPGHAARVRQITYRKCADKLRNQLAVSKMRPEFRRPASVKYAVGMVMRHIRYNYTCVIAFWDSRCKASEEWMERMGIRNLTRGMDQPFYHVLVDDGSTRYAAEENLEISPDPTTVAHTEIGLHFARFDGRRYIPNDEKKANFPEDDMMVQSLFQ